jgi:RNA polymerase sigma factor (sigma-70 family)
VVRFDDLPAKSAASTIVDDTDSPLEDLIARRERAALHTALTSLPEREARVVRLRFFDGMPSKAIAEEMHVSEARVSQLSARATTRLRAILESAALDGQSLAA